MRAFFAATAALLFVFACSPGKDASGLPTAHIVIDTAHGPAAFEVELATTVESQKKGLMFRTEMAADHGMLFDFGKEGYRSFWMKNTVLPLDMIFVRADGTISTIAENTTPYSEAPVLSSEPVRAVLEINGGQARVQGIAPGQKIHAKIFGTGP